MKRHYVLSLAYSLILAVAYGVGQLNLDLMVLWLWSYVAVIIGLLIHIRKF